MALASSNPFRISTMPYALPQSGEVVAIPSTNTAEDVRPPGWTPGRWLYSIFAYYGGGVYIRDYSALGCWAVAGSGGHAAPPNFGACLFDFEDATWKRVPNAHGMPDITQDLTNAEVNAFGEIEYPGVTGPIPAPAHLYNFIVELPPSLGGGVKGSVLIIRHKYAGSDSNGGSGIPHAFDLATGVWTRAAVGEQSTIGGRCAVYDPVTDKYFMPRYELAEWGSIPTLHRSTGTWGTLGHDGGPSSIGNNKVCFIHEGTPRLLIMHTSQGELLALNLTTRAPYFHLNRNGALHLNNSYAWHLNPLDGNYYTYEGIPSMVNQLRRIRPPADPVNGTWECDTVAVTGATLEPQPAGYLTNGAVHNNRFFYVPSLECFAWISGAAGDSVKLVKP